MPDNYDELEIPDFMEDSDDEGKADVIDVDINLHAADA